MQFLQSRCLEGYPAAIIHRGPRMEKSKPNQLPPSLVQSLQPPAKLRQPGEVAPAQDDGWHAYRKWLAADGVRTRRPEPNPSLYSWKGYQSWADKIRRSWDTDK